jgi:hypothetical protein
MKYEIIWTQDTSPSLRQDECMHHRAGAYSETQYIYGEAIRKALKLSPNQLSALVVGLGLGYIELLVMGEYLKHSPKNTCSFRLVSFETDVFLKESFLMWLKESLAEDHPLFIVFEKIGELISILYPLKKIKSALLEAHALQTWSLLAELNYTTIPKDQFSVILYDAFSGKSTPELWTEEFLKTFLMQTSFHPCVFSTYACTGVLKRNLKAVGYQVEVRPGFAGKRDSTLATLV